MSLQTSYHKILVEPAKTSRGNCKKCKAKIEKDHLRIQIFDDRKFNEFLERNGKDSIFREQFPSRGGHIQTSEPNIFIWIYYVHLNCYQPLHPHPWTKEWFKMQRFQAKHRAEMENWLQQKVRGDSAPARVPTQPKASKTKNKPIKKEEKKERKVRKGR